MFHPKRKKIFPSWLPDIDDLAGKELRRTSWLLVFAIGVLVVIFVVGRLVPLPEKNNYEVFQRVESALLP